MKCVIVVLMTVMLVGCGSWHNVDTRAPCGEVTKEAYSSGYAQGFDDGKDGKDFDPYGRTQ